MAKNGNKSKAMVESVPPECVNANNFEQRVERQAYELYVKRGFQFGHDSDDWFEAQKMVEAEMNTVDRDCIISEILYKASHGADPLQQSK